MNWLDQPLVQITLAREGEPDKILTLSPGGLRDRITVQTLEYAHKQPIDVAEFEKLAHTLRTEVTDLLRRQIYVTVIGTTLMTIHKWYSPREIVQLLERLKRDPLTTIAETRGDNFAEFVINTVQQSNEPKDTIDWYISAIREVIPAGRPDESARAIFFESIIAIAKQYQPKLALPPRDKSRSTTTTPLFEFAMAMRDITVAYGCRMLDQKGLPHQRFDGFAKLKRKGLIRRLEVARRVISLEKSMSPINYQKSGN